MEDGHCGRAAANPCPATGVSTATNRTPEPSNNRLISTTARGITPTGDAISPETIFTLPMNAVAVRVDYPAGFTGALRFQLVQGRATPATCSGQKAGPGAAWCKFQVELHKGYYTIAFIASL